MATVTDTNLAKVSIADDFSKLGHEEEERGIPSVKNINHLHVNKKYDVWSGGIF